MTHEYKPATFTRGAEEFFARCARSEKQTLKLGAFFNPTGHHAAAWRHPGAQPDAGVNFAHYAEIAQTAERGGFDFIFLADNVAVREAPAPVLARSAQYIANFEPLTLLSALAAVTKRIGLVGTASTTYNHPYHIARKFASLDHISAGRAGWNIVTSSNDAEARNFGEVAALAHDKRYDRATEFVECVLDLWDSWADDAFIRDPASGVFFDASRVRAIHHAGTHFRIDGALNVPRAPQGWPVLVQAGASDDGRAFAARFAEVVFTNHVTIESAQTYYADLKLRALRFGRDARDILVFPGLSPIVGRTEREARELNEHLRSLVDPVVGREVLAMMLGCDLSGFDLDGPLPDLPFPSNGIQSTFENWTSLARREALTIRQLIDRAVGARGKSVIVGTPAQIADHMAMWLERSAADGFNIMPPYLPGALDAFVELVIPELQERGLVRSAYGGTTLREHLDLQRPERRPEKETHVSPTSEFV